MADDHSFLIDSQDAKPSAPTPNEPASAATPVEPPPVIPTPTFSESLSPTPTPEPTPTPSHQSIPGEYHMGDTVVLTPDMKNKIQQIKNEVQAPKSVTNIESLSPTPMPEATPEPIITPTESPSIITNTEPAQQPGPEHYATPIPAPQTDPMAFGGSDSYIPPIMGDPNQNIFAKAQAEAKVAAQTPAAQPDQTQAPLQQVETPTPAPKKSLLSRLFGR